MQNLIIYLTNWNQWKVPFKKLKKAIHYKLSSSTWLSLLYRIKIRIKNWNWKIRALICRSLYWQLPENIIESCDDTRTLESAIRATPTPNKEHPTKPVPYAACDVVLISNILQIFQLREKVCYTVPPIYCDDTNR